MSKKTNLIDILKGHEGEIFWTKFGKCTYVSTILGKRLTFSMIDDHHHFETDSTGKISMFRGMSVSSTIFPSETLHDWNKWKDSLS